MGLEVEKTGRVVAHAFNRSTPEADGSLSEASLIYRLSFSAARGMQRNPNLKKTKTNQASNQQTKQNKKQKRRKE